MTEENTISLFFESWALFGDSVYAGTIAGSVLGLVGVYVVLRRMVFLSAALSQAAGLGVTLAFWSQISLGASAAVVSPTLGATLATVAVIGVLMRRRDADADLNAPLGFVFLVGACGTLIVGTRIVEELQDVQTLLFGTAVAVLPEDLFELALVGATVLALHVWWRRGFVAVSVDFTDARVRGLPVALLDFALLASLAVMVATTTRILGALPAFAFSVLPAFAALSLSRNVGQALIFAAVLGGAAGFSGYLLAFLWELPVGAAQTAVAALIAIGARGLVGGASVIRLRR